MTSVLLDDRAATARIPLAAPGDPVVVNAGGHGFYRVAYDEKLRRRISGEVLGSLDTLERYNLVDDAWNEVVAGRLTAADYLTFVEGFGGERELAVWQAIVLGLRGLGRLVDDEHYPALQARVRALLAPVVADLGDPVAGEDDLRAKLRGLLTVTLAIQGDDAATQARGAELYERGEADARPGRSGADRRGDHRGGRHRGRRGVRAAPRAVSERGDPPGPAPPPLRARRVRLRGARPAHAASWR